MFLMVFSPSSVQGEPFWAVSLASHAKPLPPQYALELLTVYAWERGNKQTDFSTARGFQTVLVLVLNYRELCIYWTNYYDFENPIIKQYLRRQLNKSRYPTPPRGSAPHRKEPLVPCGTLEVGARGRAPCSRIIFSGQSSC